MGPRVCVQETPNLVDLPQTAAVLVVGVDVDVDVGVGVGDWAGVSPLMPDPVNPERAWPAHDALAAASSAAGFTLTERLATHPPYLSEPWLDPWLAPHVAALRLPSGLAADVLPVGLQWQEPDGGLAATGRTDLHATLDTTGYRSDRSSNFDDVYGD